MFCAVKKKQNKQKYFIIKKIFILTYQLYRIIKFQKKKTIFKQGNIPTFCTNLEKIN
jgi:hypothetical protein